MGRCEASSTTARSQAWVVRMMRGSVRSTTGLCPQAAARALRDPRPLGRHVRPAWGPLHFPTVAASIHTSILYRCQVSRRLVMTLQSTLSPLEAADRLAIREVFDAYASCADRRDAEGQKALFTP